MDEQRVVARGGTAYAVMHADLHIHGRGKASYRLTRIEPQPAETPVRPDWPGTRLAALWLHGPDFPRTGEAAEAAAAELARSGWVVLCARIEHGTAEHAAQLVLAGAPGVVIIVDGADDWSVTELCWLLSNALVHEPGLPVRLLLTASTMDGLPQLRAALANVQAGVSALPISLPRPGR